MKGRLEVKGLSRSFGALRAVSEVSMTVEPGEFRAIIGPNGAGKTTFFHLLSGIILPTAGHIVMDGLDITNVPIEARCQKGLSRTFQISSVFPELTVRENVRIAAQLKCGGNFRLFGGGNIFHETLQQTAAALEMLGLATYAEQKAAAMSHGDVRLLEIAMALVQSPNVLLLDEPTQGLSADETAKTVKLLGRVSEERNLTIF